mmetsp:Transcript_90146/g.276071  ORF Transcript_90146/g.276071 Transcript_90146/m.276071 type:complete len:246 (+) Transcript_90146:1139-1876(+)
MALASTTIGPWARTQGSTCSTLGRRTTPGICSSRPLRAWLSACVSTTSWCAAPWRTRGTTTALVRRRRRPRSFRCTPARASRPTWTKSLRAGLCSGTWPRRRRPTRRPRPPCRPCAARKTATARRPFPFAATASSSARWARRRIVPSRSRSATRSWPRAWPTSPAFWREACRNATPSRRCSGRTATSSSRATVTRPSGPWRRRSAACPICTTRPWRSRRSISRRQSAFSRQWGSCPTKSATHVQK